MTNVGLAVIDICSLKSLMDDCVTVSKFWHRTYLCNLSSLQNATKPDVSVSHT